MLQFELDFEFSINIVTNLIMQLKHLFVLTLTLTAMSVSAANADSNVAAAAAPVATSGDSITASPANWKVDAKAETVDAPVAKCADSDENDLTSEDTSPDFEDYQTINNRRYKNREERRFRLRMYQETDNFIKKSNADKNLGWKVGHNQFSDMTDDEMKALVAERTSAEDSESNEDKEDDKAVQADASLLASSRKLAAVTSLPSSYKNKVLSRKGSPTLSPIRNQGGCGACWAFAMIGAIENALIVKRATTDSKGNKVYPLIDLSEQQLIDCTNKDKGVVGYSNTGCSGGNSSEAFKYITKNGLNTEAQYPFVMKDGSCKKNLASPSADTKKFTRTSIKKQSMKSLLDGIKVAPTTCGIFASRAFKFYKSGIYNAFADPEQNTSTTNHVVLCTGYDTNASKPFLEMKNSWGPNWGEKGYVRMGIKLTEGDKGPANLLNHSGNGYVQVK